MENLNRRTALKTMAIGAVAVVIPIPSVASSIIVTEVVIIEKSGYKVGLYRGPVKLVGGPFNGTVHDIPEILNLDHKKYDLHSLQLKDEKSDDKRHHSYASNKDGKTARYEGPVRYL